MNNTLPAIPGLPAPKPELNLNAKLWVDALRYEGFKQTTCRLQDENGYCCLGVACVVYERETGDELPKNEIGCYFENVLCGHFISVQNWLNLSSDMGGFANMELEEGITGNLTDLNDFFRFDFPDIADIIESQPKGLFTND